jgi:hypothetical protein
MRSGRKTTAKLPPPKTAEIIRLPHDDFSFEAYELQDSELSDRYDRDRDLVVIVEGILRTNTDALKQKVNFLPTALEGVSIGDLIHDLESASEGFDGLGKLFACAAARLSVVNAKLV